MRCQTCDRNEARFLARLDGGEWPVCGNCRDQGERWSRRITYVGLTEPPEVERPQAISWDPA